MKHATGNRTFRATDTYPGDSSVAPGHTGPSLLEGRAAGRAAEWIVRFHSYAPPDAATDESPEHQMAMKLLDDIDRHPKSVTANVTLTLAKTNWFSDFYTNSMLRYLDSDNELSFAEMVDFMRDTWGEEPPEEHARHFCTRDNGSVVFFEPLKALKSLARKWKDPRGPTPLVKKEFCQLPWAQAWLERNNLGPSADGQHAKARMVSKDAKILMLRIFYPSQPPTWKDQHAIRVGSGEDMVWTFRPLQWLDDISNLWLGGDRRSVKLTDEEMKTLQQLPWFNPWLERLHLKRKRREQKRFTDGTCGDEDETHDYTDSLKTICEPECDGDIHVHEDRLQDDTDDVAESQEV